jgi:hypothetical protein
MSAGMETMNEEIRENAELRVTTFIGTPTASVADSCTVVMHHHSIISTAIPCTVQKKHWKSRTFVQSKQIYHHRQITTVY